MPEAVLAPGHHSLPAAASHYATHVLRLEPGSMVRLFDGRGRMADAVLEAEGLVHVTEVRAGAVVAEPRVTLMCGLSKGDKLDVVVEKATEMGAAAVWPVVTERSVVRLEGERAADRVQRWQRVAMAAARQCGRDDGLQVAPVRSLRKALEAAGGEQRWVLVPGEPPLGSLVHPEAAEVILLIGPEGGLSQQEIHLAREHGFEPAGLGPFVMRAETAPQAALAVVLSRCGMM